MPSQTISREQRLVNSLKAPLLRPTHDFIQLGTSSKKLGLQMILAMHLFGQAALLDILHLYTISLLAGTILYGSRYPYPACRSPSSQTWPAWWGWAFIRWKVTLDKQSTDRTELKPPSPAFFSQLLLLLLSYETRSPTCHSPLSGWQASSCNRPVFWPQAGTAVAVCAANTCLKEM